MARTNEWTECLVDWVDGRLRQNRFSNMWLGGGAGADGGSSYRPIDGQLTQRHVCYDTSEAASPCSPSGFSSLVDNLRRIRYWQEPATWFGVTTSGAPPSGSYLNVYIKPGLWYPSTTEYCAFAGGNSPTFTLPGVLDRIDTVYIDPSGVLHIQRGTPAVLPTITLPPIASGIPLWAVHLTPTASGITFIECSGYYSGMGYIERDLRPFLNLGGGGAVASGVLPASNRGAILRGGVADWETYNVGAANEVLTNDGTDVMWSTGAIDLTAGKTLIVSANLTLAGTDGKSLTIEENSILNQDLTTDASVTFADVFVPNGGTFGISGNELLTVNAVGNFTFSGVTSIVVPDGAWVGADANCAWLFDSSNGDITAQDDVGIGTTSPEGKLDVAYGANVGAMTLLLGADIAASTRTNVTNKRTVIGAYHYTNAEEPVGMMYVFSSSLVSRLDIGGGHVLCNAATEVSIYTALNRTTLTGTKRFSVANTGAITVTGPSFTVPDGWWLGIGAATERIVIDSAGYIAFRGCNVGIGLAVPAAQCEINTATATKPILILQTTDDDATNYIQEWQDSAGLAGLMVDAATNLDSPTTTAAIGIIKKDGVRFIHNFQHPTGLTAVPSGKNTFVGKNAGNLSMGSGATQIWHGSSNLALGADAFVSNTLGYSNSAIGAYALFSNTTGSSNLALGSNAMYSNLGGYNNAAIGAHALRANTSGYSNVAIGSHSMYLNLGGYNNVAIGRNAGYTGTTAFTNVLIGYDAGYLITTGSLNAGMGDSVMRELTSGIGNVAIGARAGEVVKTGDYNVFLGFNAGRVADSVSNQLYIANTNTATPLIYGEFDNKQAGVNVGTANLAAAWHVDQPTDDAAVPVLLLDQADVDQDMIEFVCTIGVGNAIEAIGTKTLTVTHFIKITLPGPLTRYIPVGTIA